MTGLPACAAVCDAAVQLRRPFGLGPQTLTPIQVPTPVTHGSALPVVHSGSVDAFLIALDDVRPGDVVVVDNDGRGDEGCVGDLIGLETLLAGAGAIVIWGCHRDTAALLELDLPIWSLGSSPAGPLASRSRRRSVARIGGVAVRRGDLVVADSDGVVFVSATDAGEVVARAREIEASEREQARTARAGTPLRTQFQLDAYLEAKRSAPQLTFREHLRRIGREIEA